MSCVKALPLVAVFVAASPTQAQEHPQAVVLAVTGPEDEAQALTASVRELVTRLGLRLVDAADDAVARVTVALEETQALTSVANRRGELVSFRRLPRGASTQVMLEAAAHVAHSAVEELLELERRPPARRVRAGASTAPLVAVTPTGSAPQAQLREGLALELGALASGRGFGDGALPVLGGGVLVAARLDGARPWSPLLSLWAAYNGPFTQSNDVVQVSTQSFSVRLLAGARRQLSSRWRLEAQAGGGVDGFVLEAHSTTLPQPALRRPRPALSPVVSALLGVRFGLTPSTDLVLAVSADVDLLPRRFVSDIQGTREVLFEAWRVRPAVVVGFSFDVLPGDDR